MVWFLCGGVGVCGGLLLVFVGRCGGRGCWLLFLFWSGGGHRGFFFVFFFGGWGVWACMLCVCFDVWGEVVVYVVCVFRRVGAWGGGCVGVFRRRGAVGEEKCVWLSVVEGLGTKISVDEWYVGSCFRRIDVV